MCLVLFPIPHGLPPTTLKLGSSLHLLIMQSIKMFGQLLLRKKSLYYILKWEKAWPITKRFHSVYIIAMLQTYKLVNLCLRKWEIFVLNIDITIFSCWSHLKPLACSMFFLIVIQRGLSCLTHGKKTICLTI